MANPKLTDLARACWNGACNPSGLIHALPEAIQGEEPGSLRNCLELKIVIGQISFLLGESLGPSQEACSAYRKQIEEPQA
jgi:hypothetical protein